MSLVECKAGRFEGLFEDGCYQYFGIPYAKYDQRWDGLLSKKNPILKLWKRETPAPQTRSDDQSQLGTSFFQDNSLSKQSEDCLTLNICSNDIG